MNGLQHLRPVAEYGRDREHGDRLRYLAGCRCSRCRRANSLYETGRARARKSGDWNGIIPADRARRHLLELRAAGVGRRAVHLASDVAESLISEIVRGQRPNIRARTERRILAVTQDAARDSAVIDAALTWRQINQLLEEGFTKVRIAREIGQRTGGLQIGRKRCVVRTAAAVDRLWRRYMTAAGV